MAVWGGGDTPPHTIDLARSLDGGVSWSSDSTLPLILGQFGAGMGFSLDLDAARAVALMVYNSTHWYYRRPAIDAPGWTVPIRAVLNEANTSSNDDAQVTCSDPSAGVVYHSYARQLVGYQNAVRFTRSLNNGATWTTPTVLSSANCDASRMVVGPDGTLYLTWVDYALGQVIMRKSLDHGATFQPPLTVADVLDNLNGWATGWRTPYGVGQRFYPYFHNSVSEYASTPNFPSLAVDRTNGPTRGWLYLVWAENAEGTPATATTTISEVEPNDNPDNPLADFSLAQPVPLDCDINGFDASCCDGAVLDIDWFTFDGTAGETIVLDGDSHSSKYSYANLFVALPGGQRFPLSTVVFPGSTDLASGSHPKPAIITLPRTGPYVISAGGGSYTLRLRHLNVAANSVARDMRDIVMVRSTDGGQTWSPKVRVNHDAAGADQHQPNVAVDSQGRVYVAWYDRRGTALGNTVHAYASVSTDGGSTFGPDMKLSSVASEWIRPSAEANPDWTFPGNMIGDRIALTAGDDFAMAAWTDLRAFPVASVYGARIVDIPTAVTAVSDLTAEPLTAGGVRLSWRVNDTRSLTAIDVLRREGDGDESLLGSANLTGTAGEATFEDASAEPGHSYIYRLRVLSGGETGYLGPVSVQLPARITVLACRASGPNPFADRASVLLAVPRAADGVVRVYDVQGKVVRTLAEGRFEPGEKQLEWDGRDAAGASAAPGLYFVSATVGRESARAKITRLR